jgi:hypothetical protein
MENKTTTKTSTKKAKIESLLNDVKSQTTNKVKTALEGLKVHENSSLIPILIQEIDPSISSEKNALIIEFMSCIIDPAAKKTMLDSIVQQQLGDRLPLVLSTIWNSPLDYSDNLETFVEIAVTGDFMVALECLTIIENLEGPFSEKSVFESQLILSNYADTNPDKTSQKGVLISEIALLIKDFQRVIDAED